MLNKLKRLFKNGHNHTNSDDASGRDDEILSKRICDLNIVEKQLIKNVLDLTETIGEDIMVHRPNIVCLPYNQSPQDLWKTILEYAYTYYPVYDDNLDDIKGYIHVHDLAKLIQKKSAKSIKSIIKPILFVPASIPVIDILMKMRHSKAPIVIMVDEHGGTDGLLCTWDIVCHTLGDNEDQNTPDDEELYFSRLDERTVVIEGQYSLRDLIEETGLILTPDEQAEELDTVNGLIQYLTGRVPDRSEIILHDNGYEFEILESSPRAVLKVKMTKL